MTFSKRNAGFVNIRHVAHPPYDIIPCFVLAEPVFVLITSLIPDIVGSGRQVPVNNVADIVQMM